MTSPSMSKKTHVIRTGLSQTIASIEQRKNRNGPLGRRRSKFRPLLLALFLGVCFASHCEATVYYSDGSAANVQVLQALAQDGDTIIIPAGTFTWTTGVTISKAITLQGQTTTDIPNGTATDTTTIIDNLGRIPGGQPFFYFTGSSTGSARLTGITFSGQGGIQQVMPNGPVWVYTPFPLRIDHCHFT